MVAPFALARMRTTNYLMHYLKLECDAMAGHFVFWSFEKDVVPLPLLRDIFQAFDDEKLFVIDDNSVMGVDGQRSDQSHLY